jgi:hypothetical protein
MVITALVIATASFFEVREKDIAKSPVVYFFKPNAQKNYKKKFQTIPNRTAKSRYGLFGAE